MENLIFYTVINTVFLITFQLASIYLFKFNNGNTTISCEIYLELPKSTMKSFWYIEQTSHLVLAILLLTLSKLMSTGLSFFYFAIILALS